MVSTRDRQGRESGRFRLTVDVSPELGQRLKEAATRHDQTVHQYVEEVLEHAVPAETGISAALPLTADAVERVNKLRSHIMRGRVLEDDSVDIIRDVRTERFAQL